MASTVCEPVVRASYKFYAVMTPGTQECMVWCNEFRVEGCMYV